MVDMCGTCRWSTRELSPARGRHRSPTGRRTDPSRYAAPPRHESDHAVQTVSSVTQTGNDVPLLVELVIDSTDDEFH
ncbi:hypothetical protein KEM60_00129 [Austwickia sp. TVS 96-490-7B]|nr:hypothetical protein [Austwickia sp. TVS 96-490-7B]